MNRTQPFDRLVTDWLRADAPPAARATLLRETLVRVSAVEQAPATGLGLARRWLGRWPLASAAAAVVVASVVVAGLLQMSEQIGPYPSPTPTSSPGESNGPPPIPTGVGPIAGGRYSFEPIFDVPVGVQLTVPPGWQQAGWSVQRNGIDAHISFWTVETTYVDPCRWSTTAIEPPLGRSVDDLVAALRGQVGRTVTAPSPVTIDGHAGQVLTLVVPDDIGREPCDGNEYRNWVAPGNGQGSRWVPVQVGYAGYRDVVWVVDVDGLRVVIAATLSPRVTPEIEAEVRAIVDSITFDDIVAGARFGTCALVLRDAARPAIDMTVPYETRLAGTDGGAPSTTLFLSGTGWALGGAGGVEVMLVDPAGGVTNAVSTPAGQSFGADLELDQAGTWRLRVMSWAVACVADVPIEVQG